MKRLISAALAVLLAVSVTASAAGGGSGDPVISKEYLEKTYLPALMEELRESAAGGMSEAYAENFYKLSQIVAAYNSKAKRNDASQRETAGSVRFKEGDVITLAAGSSVVPDNAQTIRARDNLLVNVSTGSGTDEDDWLVPAQSYMASDTGAIIIIVSYTAQMTVSGPYTVAASSEPDYNSTADALYALGLFRGDSTGYALERAANRAEGLVMFIRMLGEEQAALSYTGTHPFEDVPSWADRYVAYAYDKKYTWGVSETRFGSSNTLTLNDYLTFVMRALKYTEGTDYYWQSAGEDAVRAGIINSAELSAFNEQGFLRAHVAYLSYYALYSRIKTTGMMLMLSLENNGIITQEQVVSSLALLSGERIS